MDNQHISAPTNSLITPATSDLDAALAQLLTGPSYAAQFLTTAADLLADDPDEPLPDYILIQVLEWADRAVFRNLPDTIRNESLTHAYTALPALDDHISGEYEQLLRDTAKEL